MQRQLGWAVGGRWNFSEMHWAPAEFSLPAPRSPTPGSRYRSMGSRRSCSSLLGFCPKCRPDWSSRSQRPRPAPGWTAVSQAGRAGRVGCPGCSPTVPRAVHCLKPSTCFPQRPQLPAMHLRCLRFGEAGGREAGLPRPQGPAAKAGSWRTLSPRVPVRQTRSWCWAWATSTTRTTSA